MKKKILAVFLAVLTMVMIIPFSAYAAGGRSVVDSGNCGLNGDNLKWTLYDDGELVISGEGEMDWYFDDLDGKLGASKPAPWSKYFDRIEVITISEGVTRVGSYALVGENIQYYKINFPKSLKYLESNEDYYGNIFDKIRDYQKEGKHIAFSYAGIHKDWILVDCKVYKFELNDETQNVERTHLNDSGSTLFSSPSSHYSEVENQSFHYEGGEPEDFCEIIKTSSTHNLERNSDNQISAHYYNSDKDAKLVWTIEGKGEFVDGDSKKMTTGPDVTFKAKGDATLKLQLVSADGEVVSEDEVGIISPSPMSLFFAEAFIYVFLAFGMFLGVFAEIFNIFRSIF